MIESIKRLQNEIIILLITILVCTLVYGFFDGMKQTAVEVRDMANSQLVQTRSQYNSALQRKQVFEQYEVDFERLKKQAIYGDEQRLNWIDAVDKTAQRYLVPYIKYRIDKQEQLDIPQLAQKFPGIDLFRSRMTLDMQLLHEGDLYTVLNGLDRYSGGLFDIQHCAVTRNLLESQSLTDSPDGKNFAARCQLNWYTMNQRTQATMPAGLLGRR